jgi:hypothetical protein
MRHQHLTVFLVVLGALFVVPAHATTVQSFNTHGTQATVETGSTDSTGCVTIFVSLDVAASITHNDGTKNSGSGASGDVQLFNSCTGVNEFGSIFADVGTGFTTGPKSATLNATIVVEMDQFDADFNFIGVVDRTLVASGLTWAADPTETFVARSHTRSTFPGSKSVSDGHSTERFATMSGTLTVDGQDVLSGPFALFETAANTTVLITTN